MHYLINSCMTAMHHAKKNSWILHILSHFVQFETRNVGSTEEPDLVLRVTLLKDLCTNFPSYLRVVIVLDSP
jgi:hypothetical protein